MEFLNHALINQTAVAALIALSYLLLWHWGGMLSFGHALLVATGAYGAYAAYHFSALVWPSAVGEGVILVPMMLLAGLLWGGLVGMVSGCLCGRWAATPFAMITLALAELASQLALSLPQWFGDEGGLAMDRGLFWSQAQRLEGLSWLLVTVTAFGILVLGRSLWALRLQAVQHHPERYAHMGGSPWAMRTSAMTLSGSIAGLAGALLLVQMEHISYHAFSAEKSTSYLLFAYLGLVGAQWILARDTTGSRPKAYTLVAAALLAAFLSVLGQTLLSRWTHLWGMVLGLAVMVTVYASAWRARHA